ncbi:membrane protein insertion efficiency factor YidD [Halobacteriovorax sp. GB3]|uniref:membrane protein insertion efficiency factor YidD n=1 Tax=Halobacteriovorax sp. GB3 TaxID=2719615 RepID=UPI0023623F92|nr:membrane protein insertion efficiency factor YidD [Halobacteriovorax sp. GB3]MDD0853773.1 membrane protein insertion efficiency factor YidD [Halobacteriovorax sp. GB3]
MKSLALLLIKFYQYFISPLLGPRCRFHPTCSNYAKQCFTTLPWYWALYYSLTRILKCHPFHEGGYDPIPKKHNKDCSCTHSSNSKQ